MVFKKKITYLQLAKNQILEKPKRLGQTNGFFNAPTQLIMNHVYLKMSIGLGNILYGLTRNGISFVDDFHIRNVYCTQFIVNFERMSMH